MNKINFFTPVEYKTVNRSYSETFLETVDGYFYLGGRKATVISPGEVVYTQPSSKSYILTTLKVISYCTVVIPLVMLALKAVLRSRQTFVLHKENRPEVSEPKPTPKPQQVKPAPSSWGLPALPSLSLWKGSTPSESQADPFLLAGRVGYQLFQGNKERVANLASINRVLKPLEKYVVEPVSDCLTKGVLQPLLEMGGNLATRYLPVDPISTRKLQDIGDQVEGALRFVAEKKPIDIPVLRYASKTVIVVARTFLPSVKTLNAALQLPAEMRAKAAIVFKNAREHLVKDVADDAFKALTIEWDADAGWMSWMGRHIWNFSAEIAIEGAERTAASYLDKYEVKVSAKLNKKEALLRQKIVKIAATKFSQFALSFSTKWMVRYALVTVVNESACFLLPMLMGDYASYLSHSLPFLTAKASTVAGLALWGAVLMPAFKDLHAAYSEEYSEGSLYKSLSDFVDVKRHLNTLKTAVSEVAKKSSYLNKFMASVEADLLNYEHTRKGKRAVHHPRRITG